MRFLNHMAGSADEKGRAVYRRGCSDAAAPQRLPALTITLYGIPNCDTVKRARRWLDARQVDYAFHDYKIAGIERTTLEQWCRDVGWETLLNRSGTTFRKLDESQRAHLDAGRALALMQSQPSMIRRPVLDTGVERVVGFDEPRYEAAIGHHPDR